MSMRVGGTNSIQVQSHNNSSNGITPTKAVGFVGMAAITGMAILIIGRCVKYLNACTIKREIQNYSSISPERKEKLTNELARFSIQGVPTVHVGIMGGAEGGSKKIINAMVTAIAMRTLNKLSLGHLTKEDQNELQENLSNAIRTIVKEKKLIRSHEYGREETIDRNATKAPPGTLFIIMWQRPSAGRSEEKSGYALFPPKFLNAKNRDSVRGIQFHDDGDRFEHGIFTKEDGYSQHIHVGLGRPKEVTFVVDTTLNLPPLP